MKWNFAKPSAAESGNLTFDMCYRVPQNLSLYLQI